MERRALSPGHSESVSTRWPAPKGDEDASQADVLAEHTQKLNYGVTAG